MMVSDKLKDKYEAIIFHFKKFWEFGLNNSNAVSNSR